MTGVQTCALPIYKDEEEVEESLNPDVDQNDEAESETVYVAYVSFFSCVYLG